MRVKLLALFPAMFFVSVISSGCEVVGFIFEEGVWTGPIGVVVILIVLILIIAKLLFKNED